MPINILQILDFSGEAVKQQLPNSQNPADPRGNFGNTIGGLLSISLAIASLLVFFYLIWGGIEWITSGGDKSKAEGARNKMTQAVIGIVVLAAIVAIFSLIQSFLGICVLSFSGSC